MKSVNPSSSAVALSFAAFVTFAQLTSAQSNDEVCFAPVGEGGSIGNVSFEAPIASSPLFWIASVKHDNNRMMTRQFHLFTEDRSVQLGTEESDFNGCGLALTGVMKTDRTGLIPDIAGQGNPGCVSILEPQCANDVLEQVKEELDAVLRNATASTTAQQVCGDVRDRLFTSAEPSTCINRRIWASLSDMVLTGDGADVVNTTYSEGESDCADHAQVTELYDRGNTFSLFPLASFRVPQEGNLREAGEWINTSTPMISIFWAKDGSSRAGLEQPAISLDCVAATNETNTGVPQQESGVAGRATTQSLAMCATFMLAAIGLASL